MKFPAQILVLFAFFAAAATGFTGCASTGGNAAKKPGSSAVVPAEPTPAPVKVEDYLQILDRLAPGDPARQYATVADLAAVAQADPTASNRLKYALALGAAGRANSNPIEAQRLLTELLAEGTGLTAEETSLANAWLREFDARVALYADLSRQREESERSLKTADAEADRRIANLNAELQRARKALADAERKLEAVAEMEQSLVPPEGQPR